MPHNALPADLNPQDIVAVVDTREQLPWDLAPLRMQPGTLATGDYSVFGLESVVAIERKSLSDFLACCGTERERFDREIQRLLGYQVRAVVVEADWPMLESGDWRSKIKPASVIGSVLSWTAAGVPVLLAGTRERSAQCVSRMLYLAARRRWREARTLVAGVIDPHADPISPVASEPAGG